MSLRRIALTGVGVIALSMAALNACSFGLGAPSSSGEGGAAEDIDGSCTLQASTPFQQYYKCMGEFKSLGDQGSESNCLAACLQQSGAQGCWYLDGTGGFPRDCRICTGGPPSQGTFPNDWATTLTCAASSSSGSSSGVTGSSSGASSGSSSGVSSGSSSGSSGPSCNLGATFQAPGGAMCPSNHQCQSPPYSCVTPIAVQQGLKCCCDPSGIMCIGCKPTESCAGPYNGQPVSCCN